MNCKHVEPLLPLYIGSDLDEEQTQLVAGHLQNCTGCSLVADEYAGTSQLLQLYEGPVFSEEIYARLRAQVLNEIERESHAPVRPGIFSLLFLPLVQPRMRWITAAVLLAVSVTALYLSRNALRQRPIDQQTAVRSGEPKEAGVAVQPDHSNESAGLSSLPNKKHIRTATTGGPITRQKVVKRGVVATNLTRELAQATRGHSPADDRVVVGGSQPLSDPAPVRMEIQTSDRNIRIIWLSGQHPGADGTDGSKGL